MTALGASGDNDSAGDAARRAGRDVIAQVDLGAITVLLDRLPTGALLKALDAIIETLATSDAPQARQRAGLLGRLLGNDLVAMARPDPIDARLRVHLAVANGRASELETHLGSLAECSAHLQRQLVALQQIIAQPAATSRRDHQRAAATGPDDAWRRRVSHLQVIADSWRMTVTQMALAASHAEWLLDRHVQVREVLLPLWRQLCAGRAVSRKLQEADASALCELHGTIHRQLAALRAPTQQPAAVSTQSSSPSPKEPSP